MVNSNTYSYSYSSHGKCSKCHRRKKKHCKHQSQNKDLRSLSCLKNPIGGFQARKPNRIGCNDKKKHKKIIAVCHGCGCSFRLDNSSSSNKLNYFANRDFECARIYNCFSTPNVQSDRSISRKDPNLPYRTRPIKYYGSSRDLCKGLCRRCLQL